MNQATLLTEIDSDNDIWVVEYEEKLYKFFNSNEGWGCYDLFSSNAEGSINNHSIIEGIKDVIARAIPQLIMQEINHKHFPKR